MKNLKKSLLVVTLALCTLFAFNTTSTSMDFTNQNSLAGVGQMTTATQLHEANPTKAIFPGLVVLALAESTYVVTAAAVTAVTARISRLETANLESKLD